jgi:hypothetical protein
MTFPFCLLLFSASLFIPARTLGRREQDVGVPQRSTAAQHCSQWAGRGREGVGVVIRAGHWTVKPKRSPFATGNSTRLGVRAVCPGAFGGDKICLRSYGRDWPSRKRICGGAFWQGKRGNARLSVWLWDVGERELGRARGRDKEAQGRK